MANELDQLMHAPTPPDEGGSMNAWMRRFQALTFGGESFRAYYAHEARKAGLKFGPETKLSPHILPATTPISTNNADPLNGVPVAMSAANPTVLLRYYFQDPAFIRRCTATAPVMRLNPNGQPDMVFAGKINPLDYIYAQLRRDGSGDVFMTNPMPLSEFSGDGAHSYFWNLVPVVRQAGSLLLELTIIPPGNPPLSTPPFVDWCGIVNVSLHTERFAEWGV